VISPPGSREGAQECGVIDSPGREMLKGAGKMTEFWVISWFLRRDFLFHKSDPLEKGGGLS
jgi:hypothetical protein